MNSNLSTSRILELLNRLRTALEDFAARSGKLDTDMRIRAARERQLCDRALHAGQAEHEAALAQAEQDYAAAKVRMQEAFEHRKAWIGKAYQSSKEAAIQKVEQAAGSRKFDLQRYVLQAERDRDAGYAAAMSSLESLRNTLAAENATLSQLESQARRAFMGYGKFRRGLAAAYEKAEADSNRIEEDLASELRRSVEDSRNGMKHCRGALQTLFRFLPLWVILAFVPLGTAIWLNQSGRAGLAIPQALGAGIALLALAFAGRWAAVAVTKPYAAKLSASLGRARRLHDTCAAKAEASYTAEVERVRNEYQKNARVADSELKATMSEAGHSRVSFRMAADKRAVEIGEKNNRFHIARVARFEAAHHGAVENLKRAWDARAASLKQACEGKVAAISHEFDAEWQRIQSEWDGTVPPIFEVLSGASEAAEKLFPAWETLRPETWIPPKQFVNAAKYGSLQADLAKACASLPKDKRLGLPGPTSLELPLCLAYPNEGSVLFETNGAGHDQAVAALNNLILRLLAGSPPGRLNFTILDPVGLGQNFAGIMHMADYEEQIINSRIWTQPGQIEEKLAQLNEHMEKVIQMYLRNEYQTIAEYNEQAGVIAEKYHFLVVADFPSGFTDTAVRRLLSIAASGPRCGVYTLIHFDKRQQQQLPQDVSLDDLRKNSVHLAWKTEGRAPSSKAPADLSSFVLVKNPVPGTRLLLDSPPPAEAATEFVNQVGKLSRDSSRVEVPFEHVTPSENEFWSLDTGAELRVAIGRTGATKLQYLAMGKGTRQHGLVAGKTGSGKSTLFHVVITNLSLWCSPEQVEFYLVDFKKGVEFKCYATRHLPHARVVAIESDREFGLSVLQRVDDELKRRGDLFRKLGVQDIPGYKRVGGTEPMPRCLLLIDEFQEFFVEDDKIAQAASLLLDRIVRQGRAFGIHVLLGSQTLGGAYTVARTTLGQMVIRIALQCNEADAYLIMEDDNPAPRLLSRPGEAIYNDAAGAIEGNSPFQIVWLSDETRDRSLEKVRALADRSDARYPGPIVFEGNAPADAAENPALTGLLSAPLAAPAPAPRIWLGAPNSIKGPTEAVFHRQSGNNLIIVGQREEAALAMFAVGALALSAQFPAGKAEIYLLDSSAPGTSSRDYLEALIGAAPRNLTMLRPGDVPELMARLAARKKDLETSADPESGSPVFLLIHGLQRFSKLRHEEDFSFSSSDDTQVNPGAILNDLVSEGTRLGFHVIASCDSYNNVNRFMSRKALTEFEMRVVFQMSVNDSANLIDNPRASTLGLHRALFFNAKEGYLETFRPYALPPKDWVVGAASKLK